MALTAPAITASIQAAGPDLLGPTFPLLATAVGIAVQAWVVLPANFAMTGVTTGLAGTGVVNGKIITPPNPTLMAGALTSAGVVGPTSPRIGSAIAIGVANAFTSFGQYAGVSAGVGSGIDLSVVSVVNTPTLISALLAAFQGSFGGTVGPTAPLLATGLGNGLGLTLAASTTAPGTGIVFGPGAGPSAGTSLSSVF